MTVAAVEGLVSSLRALAERANAWPFEEARKVVARLKKQPKDEVIFETGYGPSGLPHIGTFGEVARTTMVRHAFRVLTDDMIKTRLIAFSDDMDGLRKVPDNIPEKEMVAAHLGKPLTRVPDPFGTHPSFGEHNNARLRAFLDQFGFDYEFLSSTVCYSSGRFDQALLTVLERFDKVMAIMLPSLRAERAQTYSPFLPVCPRTGVVLQVPIVDRDVAAGTISYDDPETGERIVTPVTGGRCKLQWKPDWAMRWVALGVDYEMAGKDLIDSVKLSGDICRALGGAPPEGFNYELFLDEKGQKISKSKGNGLTIEEWLRYASPESLSLFMYREPKAAKRLYFDVIPRCVDEYQQLLDGYQRQDERQRLSNPVWHIHTGSPPAPDVPISFTMLLNLVSASNAENADTLWGFIGRYWPGVTRETSPKLNQLVEYAIHYFRDFVLPAKKFREPTDPERAALQDLRDALSQLSGDAPAERIQEVVYEVGRREPFLDDKKKGKDGKPGVSLDWFNLLYQVLLGQEKGPRFGSFVAIYGLQNTIDMIDGALARSADSKTDGQEEPQTPPWLQATMTDLDDLDFEAPITGSKSAESNELSELYSAAASASAETAGAASRVFSMLSAATGLLFKPQDRNEPFGPMVFFADGRRSATPTDFRTHADMLADIATRATHPVLRARLADLCWLLDRKRGHLGAIAVAAYVDIVRKADRGELLFRFEEDRGALKHDARDLLRRALQIGWAIGWNKPEVIAARDLTNELRTQAVQKALLIPAFWFSELDLDFRVSEPATVGAEIENLIAAQEGAASDNLVWLWRLAARAYHLAKNNDAQHRCQSEAAEVLVSMAERQASAMLASTMLSEAIAELHGLPGKKDRRKELRHRLIDVQAEISEEMAGFSYTLDLEAIVKQTSQSVDRPQLLDKLFVFAALACSPEPAELLEKAKKEIGESLSSLFSATHHDREGKVIHRTEGHSPDGAGDGSALQRQIAQGEEIRRKIIASGQIEVARQAIMQHHYLSDNVFVSIFQYSAFVPSYLRATFARGFMRFFQGDYVSSLYILTPLLENSLRHVLKVHGHDVTFFDDATQIQQDRTISSLFEQMRSEMDGIFGRAITTDIENVFLIKPGPSLRHRVAHGLLHDGDPYDADAIYGCWLIFHLCLLPLFRYRDQLRLPLE